MKTINIKGGKVHNLKGVGVSIPKNKFVVATGVSGSGKSSLMFEIVFEEGRKQYLTSLGVFNDLEDVEKFDSIEGIGPTIAVKQNIIRQSNPRSTVGSRTGVLNLISLVLATDGLMSCAACDGVLIGDMVCPNCGFENERLTLNYFSYNHPNGMCLTCSGRGHYYDFNMEKLLPSEETTLGDLFESLGLSSGFKRLVERRFGAHFETHFVRLPNDVKIDVLYGHHVGTSSDKKTFSLSKYFQSRVAKDGKDFSGVYFRKHCDECHGFRVGEDAQRVRMNGRHIGELAQMTTAELFVFLQAYSDNNQMSIASKKIINEAMIKLRGMVDSKLGHLTLYREMPSLSGGEIQRLFLFHHLISKMDSLIYVLDEPTVGLHESEKYDLIRAMERLRDMGNSVIVVEHDPAMIKSGDHIIDVGPRAGINGGEIVYEGSYEGLLQDENSITGAFLSGQKEIPTRDLLDRETIENHKKLKMTNGNSNNLKSVDVEFP